MIIPNPPQTENVAFDTWLSQLVVDLRKYGIYTFSADKDTIYPSDLATSGATKENPPAFTYRGSVWGGDISTPVVSPASPVITVSVLHHDKMTTACTGFQVKWTNATSTWNIESGTAQYPNATISGTANYFKLDLDGVLKVTPYGNYYPKDIYGEAASSLSADTTVTFDIVPQAISVDTEIKTRLIDEDQPNTAIDFFLDGHRVFEARTITSPHFGEMAHGLRVWGRPLDQDYDGDPVDDYPHTGNVPPILVLVAPNLSDYADYTYDGVSADIDVSVGNINLRPLAGGYVDVRAWTGSQAYLRTISPNYGHALRLWHDNAYAYIENQFLPTIQIHRADGADQRLLWLHAVGGGSKIAFLTGATSKGFQIFEDYWGTVEEGVNFQVRPSGTDIDDNWSTAFFIKYTGDVEVKNNLTAAGLLVGGIIATGVIVTDNIKRGPGTPEGSITGVVGDLYTRTDGGAGTTLYVKESGAGNTGWIGK